MTASSIARDAKGGLVTSTSCLAYSIANGALIYSGTLQPMLGKGIAAGLVTTAIVSVVLAFTSGFRPVIGTANSTTGAPLGAVLAALAPALGQVSAQSAVATVYVVIGLTTLAAGLTLVALGSARLGTIVRFIPFPIFAGFMGVTGTLVLFGAVRLSTGIPVQMARLAELARPGNAVLLGLVAVTAVLSSLVTRRFKHPLAGPGLLVALCVVADASIYASGYSIARPPLPGFFLIPKGMSVFDLPLLTQVPAQASWHLVWPLFGSIAAYVVLVVMATLLTTTGLESALNVDSDYNRELRAQGLAIAASGCFGGFVGNPSVGFSMACAATGSRGPSAGIANAVVMVAFLLLGLWILPFVPRFVVGGLLAQLGATVIASWCIATRTKMPRGEWLLSIGIVGVTIWAGLVPAIVSGLVGGCIVFALDVSRIDIVRRSYGLDQRASPVVRPGDELAILSDQGRRVQVIELHGTLFFGCAYQILLRVEALIAAHSLSLIILDLTAVHGCDSSTMATLARMRRLLAREGIAFAVAGGSQRVIELMRTSNSLEAGDAAFTTRDDALEAAEILVLRQVDAAWPHPKSLEEWLTEALGSKQLAHALCPELKCSDHPPGAYLCRQGDPTDTLLFIESGRVGVVVGPPGAERCVRIFGPQTIAGEHGFVLQLPRTASLKVENAARVWTLARRTFDRLQVDRPDLVVALLRDVVRLQSERLAFATRQNMALS